MANEKEKQIEQIQKLRPLLPEKKQGDLAQILAFGEKSRQEWEDLKNKFWEYKDKPSHIWWLLNLFTPKREEFLSLLTHYETIEKQFLEWLPYKERQLIENMNKIEREKFFKEYLFDRILYGWKIWKTRDIKVNSQSIKKMWLEDFIEKWKGKIQPWMTFDFADLYELVIESTTAKNTSEICKTTTEWVCEMLKWRKDSLKPWVNIYLRWNHLWDNWIKAIVGELEGALQPGMYIWMGINSITDDWFEFLVKQWKNSLKPWLQLDFYLNNISKKWVEVLAKEWKESLQLWMSISLQDNHIWNEWIEILAKEWKNSLKPWMKINLYNTRMDEDWMDILINEWAWSLQPWLKVYLGNNSCGNYWLTEISKKWELKNYMVLDLCRTQISNDGLVEMAKNLKLSEWVTLKLSNNIFDDKWVESLIENLELKNWVTLDLSYNTISDKMGKELKKWKKRYEKKWVKCNIIFGV